MDKPLIEDIQVGNNNQLSPFELDKFSAAEKATDSQIKATGLFSPIRILSAIPNYVPQNFNEQFAIYNGTLYIYISGAWQPLGAQYATGKLVRSNGATGAQIVTGLSFKPRLVKILAMASGNDHPWSQGFMRNGGTAENINMYKNTTGSFTMDEGSGRVIWLQDDAGDVANVELTSFNDDGFTLTWWNINHNVWFMWEAYS